MSQDINILLVHTINVSYANYSSGRNGEAIGAPESSSTAANPGSEHAFSALAPDPATETAGQSDRAYYRDLFIFLLIVALGAALTFLISQSVLGPLGIFIFGLATTWRKVRGK